MPEEAGPPTPVRAQAGNLLPASDVGGLTQSPDSYATADYILSMSRQLAKLATEARLEMLSYLLDMVRLEAELVRERTAPPEPAQRRA